MEKELENATKLFFSRKYSEALKFISKIDLHEDLDNKIRNSFLELRIRSLIRLEKLEEAYNIIEEAIENYKTKKDWTNVLDCLFLICEIKKEEFKIKDIIKIVNEGEEILKQITKITPSLQEKKAWLLYWKGDAYLWSWEINKALTFLLPALKIAEEISNKNIEGNLLHDIALAKGIQGDYELAIRYENRAIECLFEIDKAMLPKLYHNLCVFYAERGEYKKSREYEEKVRDITGDTPINIASIGHSYWYEGELEKGLDYLNQGLKKIQDKFENYSENEIILFVMGNILSRKGELNKAIEKYQKVLNLTENNLIRKPTYGYCNIGIASCYLHKGELDLAEEHSLKGLEIFESFDGKYGLGLVHFLLAQIYFERDNYNDALTHAQLSLEAKQKIENKQEIALTIRLIITLLLEEKNFEKVDSYFKQIKQLAETTDDKIIDQSYRLSEALILKSKVRPKYWMKAIDVLENLVNDKIVNYGITITALILLCELFLSEFSLSGDDEVLLDLQKYTSKIIENAKEQNSYTLRVEAYNMRILSLWLQAQYSKVDIEIQNARELLIEAQELADVKGLVKLARKIKEQHMQLLDQLQNWDEFIRKYYEFIKS